MENIDIIHVSMPVSACPACKSGCDGHSGHIFHWTSSAFIRLHPLFCQVSTLYIIET